MIWATTQNPQHNFRVIHGGAAYFARLDESTAPEEAARLFLRDYRNDPRPVRRGVTATRISWRDSFIPVRSLAARSLLFRASPEALRACAPDDGTDAGPALRHYLDTDTDDWAGRDALRTAAAAAAIWDDLDIVPDSILRQRCLWLAALMRAKIAVQPPEIVID